MKKISFFLSLFFVFALLSSANASWISFQENDVPTKSSIELMNSDWNQIELRSEINGVSTETANTEEGEFSLLTMQDNGYTTEIGAPRLPVIRELIEIPYDAEWELEIVDMETDEATLSDWEIREIMPVQPPLPKIEGAEVEFALDASAYQIDEFYPVDIVNIKDVGAIRGHRVVMVEINPIRYNPAQDKISYISDITIDIKLSGANYSETITKNENYYSKNFNQTYSKHILNYNSYLGRDLPTTPIGYLIIVADDFGDDIQDFADWKFHKGFKVTVTPVSEIGASTNQIKSYLQDAYDNWDVPPTYVLFAGDTNTIPTWTGEASGTADDSKYGELDGNDIIPDIMIGRWTTETEAHFQNILDKSIYYENPTEEDFEWMKKATFIGSEDHWQLIEGTHNDMIDWYFEPNGMICDVIYERLGGNTQDITNSVNDGRTIVNYSGHGSWTTWASVPFTTGNVHALENTYMYPFVMSNACQTGNFAYSSESFGEAWIRDENAAMSFFGASNNSYWDEDDYLERGVWEAYWEEGFTTVGGICNDGLLAVYTQYGGGGSVPYYYDIYNVQGDPSIDIYNYVAEVPEVVLPSSIVIGQPEISVEVPGVENALVCFYTESEADPIHVAGYTDADGMVTFDLSGNPPMEICDWTISVTGHNLVPYDTTGMVFGGTAYEGCVTDIETGDPLSAEVYIESENMISDARQEDGFYRLYVLEGDTTYTIEADYWGYQHVMEADVYVAEDDTTDLDIEMTPLENAGTIQGYITTVTGEPIPDVAISLLGVQIPSTLTDANGFYQIQPLVPDYEYDAEAYHPSYEMQSQTITLNPNEVYQLDFTMAYTEIFEENDGGFVGEDEWEWGIPTLEGGPDEGAYSGENCWGTDIDDNYDPSSNMYLYSPYYTLTLSENPSLVFYTWYEMQDGWDGGNIKISTDYGETWELITPVDGYPDHSIVGLTGQPGFTGDSETWLREEFDLTDYADSTVQFAFRFASTNSTYRGWFIDNLAVNGGYHSAAMPADFIAEVVNEDDVDLSWNEPDSPLELTGFNLYRRTSEEEEFGEPIAVLESDEFSYTDVNMDIGEYYYGLTAIYSGDLESQKCMESVTIGESGVDEKTPNVLAPNRHSLSQNYPNPFNPSTQINFALPQKEAVSLKIYNLQGNLVKTLVNEEKDAGYYNVVWNGSDDSGKSVASGLYIYRITAGEYTTTKRMILLK